MFEGLFQPMHMIIILGIVMIIWGPGKLPELGEGLGKSIKAFKKVMKDEPVTTPVERKKEEKTQQLS